MNYLVRNTVLYWISQIYCISVNIEANLVRCSTSGVYRITFNVLSAYSTTNGGAHIPQELQHSFWVLYPQLEVLHHHHVDQRHLLKCMEGGGGGGHSQKGKEEKRTYFLWRFCLAETWGGRSSIIQLYFPSIKNVLLPLRGGMPVRRPSWLQQANKTSDTATHACQKNQASQITPIIPYLSGI